MPNCAWILMGSFCSPWTITYNLFMVHIYICNYLSARHWTTVVLSNFHCLGKEKKRCVLIKISHSFWLSNSAELQSFFNHLSWAHWAGLNFIWTELKTLLVCFEGFGQNGANLKWTHSKTDSFPKRVYLKWSQSKTDAKNIWYRFNNIYDIEYTLNPPVEGSFSHFNYEICNLDSCVINLIDHRTIKSQLPTLFVWSQFNCKKKNKFTKKVYQLTNFWENCNCCFNRCKLQQDKKKYPV
jgi:hypothetical protein